MAKKPRKNNGGAASERADATVKSKAVAKSEAAAVAEKDGTARIKKPLRKRWQLWTAVAVAAVVIILALVTVCDYSILSACIKTACKPKNIPEPENYSEITEATVAEYDLPYTSQWENNSFDLYYPNGAFGKLPTLIYIHGGYYLGGDKKSAEPYCRTIAKEGYTVISLNYALAPKYKYPTQLRQVNEAIGFILENGEKLHVDVEQIFIGGDSAGGHLAAQLGAFYTNAEFAAEFTFKPNLAADSLKGLLLLCGFYNMDTVKECKFPFFNTAMWAFTDVRDYLKYARVDELSIVEHVTKDYPDVFLTCGADDPFYSQAEEMQAALEKNKVNCEAYLPSSPDNELKHEYQRDFSLPECNEAMNRTLSFMRARSTLSKAVLNARAVFSLDTGDAFVVKLYPQYAPETVANFIKYAEEGFYDGTYFHRVISGVLQGGGYVKNDKGELVPKTGTYPPIKGEFADNGFERNTLKHIEGAISMARTNNPDSATSQFFFCSTTLTYYDGQYAVFGQIISGGENLKKLTSAECIDGTDTPKEPVKLISVRIVYGDED